MLMNAAVGSAKNITPNREKAASNEAGSKGNTWASAWTKRTRCAPFGRALRERQHRSRQIDPHDRAVRRDGPGKGQRGLTPATAYVQDALARARRKRRQSAPTKRSELQFQWLPDLRPRADPYFVLGQRGQGADLVHAGIIARRSGNVEVAWSLSSAGFPLHSPADV